jgi:phenylacetate-CoA ligase
MNLPPERPHRRSGSALSATPAPSVMLGPAAVCLPAKLPASWPRGSGSADIGSMLPPEPRPSTRSSSCRSADDGSKAAAGRSVDTIPPLAGCIARPWVRRGGSVGRVADDAQATELHRRQLADMLGRSGEFGARLRWMPAEVREQQTAALRRLLRAAAGGSPWHARRLEGVDPGAFEVEDLRGLPAMTKADLMAGFDDIVTDRRLSRALAERHLASLESDSYLLGRYHVVTSGGSSGQRGVFVYDWDAWPAFYLSMQRFFQRDWSQDRDLDGIPQRVAVVAASRATHMSSALAQTFTRPGAELRNFPVTRPMEQIVAGLNQWQPTVLQGYASILHQLCAEARSGRLRIRPRRIRSRSEPLLPQTRADLEDTWGVTVHNEWVCTEGASAATCGAGRGLHLSEDLVIIEPVDAAGGPVPAGVLSGKVYLTNLYNLALPLIRYELTDQMSFLPGACPCGTAFARIEDVQGRLEDLFIYGPGTRVHRYVFASVLGLEPGVIEYQVRQTPAGADITVVTDGPVDTGRIGREISTALSRLGLPDPVIHVCPAAALDRTAMGKLRRFIPLPRTAPPA